MTVKPNAKIEQCLAILHEQTNAKMLEPVLNIFGISMRGEWSGPDLARDLPGRTMVVYNTVIHADTPSVAIRVVTEIFYRDDDAAICYDALAGSGAPGEELQSAERRLVRLNTYRLLTRILGYDPNPWGILTGVRPSKIVHRWLDAAIPSLDVTNRLCQDYAIRVDKAELITQISLRQRQCLLPPAEVKKLISVYVGIPFCPTRCLYCSFPAYVLPKNVHDLELFMGALAQDIAAAGKLIDSAGLKVQAIYIGGGTPTSLAIRDFVQLLEMVQDRFVSSSLREFTVEAGRPDTMDDDKIRAMKNYGISRVSVNPQTMQQRTLKHIGRRHTVQDIIDVFGKLREMGFPVINMDLIAGLPGETEQDMADTLERIVSLNPDNFTVHTLAIKKGSRLKELVGSYPMPGPAATAAMVQNAAYCARTMGMYPYYLYRQKQMTGNLENVGYTKPGLESLYNIHIIEERQTIIGIGPAATTKFVTPDWQVENLFHAKDVATYISTLPKYINKREKLFRLWMG